MKHRKAVQRVPGFLAIIAAGAALTLGASWAAAKERPFPPPSPERIVSHLGEKLDLTTEQERLLAPVIEESAERHREIARKYDRQERGMRRVAREERQAVESDVETQLASILTAEQMEEYLQLKDERQSRRRGGERRGGRGEGRRDGGPSPDRMVMHLSEELGLTADQEEKLLPIFEESFEQRRELFESVSSQARGERSAVREQMEAIADDVEAKVAGVLTAEQMEEFNELREERQSRREKGRHSRGRGRF